MIHTLGDTTCQWPQPGVPMYYPACTGTAPQGLTTPVPGGSAPSTALSAILSPSKAIYNVGDAWTLVVTGAPNQPVSMSGGKNGANATASFGNTDSNGRFTLTGSFQASEVGSWQETWNVGQQVAGRINFAIQGAQASKTADAMDKGNNGLDVATITQGLAAIPTWAMIGGAVLAIFLVVRK